ncbi:hypothetical protein AB0K60_24830 [Thermopolyspora sp. NPDC052614]|uniref:hypothetical protein n=1 Tax=Thermopolyspora sp. NPDC052614 TaxID=3155682 RepID=UPI00342426F7
MPTAITITGARSTEHRPKSDYDRIFAEYLGPFALPGVTFYLGGARGIDSLALLWLAAETEAVLHVVVPGTLAAQPEDAREAVMASRERGRLAGLIELNSPSHPSVEGYHRRNRWMVDKSELVVGFPRGTDRSSGTWYTLEYAALNDKARLIKPI